MSQKTFCVREIPRKIIYLMEEMETENEIRGNHTNIHHHTTQYVASGNILQL